MSESSTIDNKQVRIQLLKSWFQSVLAELSPNADFDEFTVNLVQGDASFRRYFRAQNHNESYILVDAPPDKENSQAFVDIANAFSKDGVQVPTIYQLDLEQGFLCLSDFGDTLLWSKLKQAQSLKADATSFYHEAFKQLLLIQQVSAEKLPLFSEDLMQQVMDLFRHWF
jgi:N-acetylmuramate 1-kinase